MKRNCIYTGEESGCKDKVIPHDEGDIDHNWSNSVPCSHTYKSKKGYNYPTELELDLSRAFYQMELAKKDLHFWEREYKMLLEINKKRQKPAVVEQAVDDKKENEIEMAYKDKEIQEVNLDNILDEKMKTFDKGFWDE
jgi:hypothetical protein